MIVAKFGGSSLADAEQFMKVRGIILMNRKRKCVIPSAPGTRFPGDRKITDLLYAFHDQSDPENARDAFEKISERYLGIARELNLQTDIGHELDVIRANVLAGASADYTASRGEYLCGRMLADFLGWTFIDAADVIFFDRDGVLEAEKTYQAIAERFSHCANAVIPGFYGSGPDGSIRTFSRGGSDITGAIVSHALNAELYENWTDVTGFRMADPRIVPDARFISALTYRELRELSYMGASVLHEDAVFPVHSSGIPTNIRNTNHPEHPGTIISSALGTDLPDGPITGIAGTKGFTIVSIEKDMMNSELGFGRKVLQAFEDYGVNFEHAPTGIDAMSVVVSGRDFTPHKKEIIAHIKDAVHPDQITIQNNIALIAIVGRGIAAYPGTAARLLSALSSSGISLRIIDQGYGELSIILGIDEDQFEPAIKAIYDTFIRI